MATQDAPVPDSSRRPTSTARRRRISTARRQSIALAEIDLNVRPPEHDEDDALSANSQDGRDVVNETTSRASAKARDPLSAQRSDGMPTRNLPPGQMPPGQMPPGQMPPGQMPPGQLPRRRPLYKNPWIWAALIGIAILTAIRPLMQRRPEPLPVITQLPSFSFTDQRGRAFGSAQLAGKPYIASFFFTHCKTICDGLSKKMREAQDRFAAYGRRVNLVSITVDPENDTPAALAKYAKDYGADGKRWRLLTAPETQIRALVTDGFRLHVGKKTKRQLKNADAIDIAHSGSLILVDKRGAVRGLFDPKIDAQFKEAYHRAVALSQE